MTRPTILAAALALIASPALADPCEAPLPKPGTVFSGPVTWIIDGDGLCLEVVVKPHANHHQPLVPQGLRGGGVPRENQWVEVRIADFYAPELNSTGGREAKATLERIAKGKRATCVAGKRSYDRVVAVCRIGSRSIGELMRRAGVAEGGRGRR